MSKYNYPTYSPQSGYMTETIRTTYINEAVSINLLPSNAHRMQSVITLNASNDLEKPIQFWQLYSVLGSERIIAIVQNFYRRVYSDEQWFASVFARVASEPHHVGTQSSMWMDVMGGGHQYHGAEFRLHFHHTHNAILLMNIKGAERWVKLMTETLDDPELDYTDDPRVRPAINTFLTYFLGKYADEFKFVNCFSFGDTNSSVSVVST